MKAPQMTPIRNFIGGLSLCLIMASCATPPPTETVSTGLDVPSQWPSSSTNQPVVEQWWTTFKDPQIAQLVEEAWNHNPSLQVAVARLDAASAESRIAGAGRFPTLGLNFDTARRKQNFIGLPIPGSGSSVLASHSTTYGVSLNTLWELDIWGRVRSAHAASLADLQASQENLRAAHLSLAAQTIKAWAAVVEARQQVELAQNTATSYASTAQRVESRYVRGIRSSLDLRLALNSRASADSLLVSRKQQLDRAVRQLEILVGRYPNATYESATKLPDLSDSIPAGLPSELLQRRPDLIAAERRIAASKARVRQAKASLYPRISLTASGGTSTDELSDLVSSDFLIWSWALNFAQPIFEGGRLRANRRLAEARAREQFADYASTLLRAFAEVETALAAEHWLDQREAFLTEAARQATAAQELARNRYDSGLADFITVLEAQRSALSAQSQLISVQRLRVDTRVDLHLALGGGFQAPPPAPDSQHAKGPRNL